MIDELANGRALLLLIWIACLAPSIATGESLGERLAKSETGLQTRAVIEATGLDVMHLDWQEPKWPFGGEMVEYYGGANGRVVLAQGMV